MKSWGGGDVSVWAKNIAVCASRLNRSMSILVGGVVVGGFRVKFIPRPSRLLVPGGREAFSVRL